MDPRSGIQVETNSRLAVRALRNAAVQRRWRSAVVKCRVYLAEAETHRVRRNAELMKQPTFTDRIESARGFVPGRFWTPPRDDCRYSCLILTSPPLRRPSLAPKSS